MTTLIQKVNAGFVRVAELLKGKVNSTRQIVTGTGLTGGGDLTADRTLTLADSGVVAGTYGSSTSVPVITLDAKGRVVTATTATVSGGGGTTLTWVDLTVLTANGFASGFATGTANKLQIAKDSSGYVWIRGVIRNTSSSTNSNTLAVLPTAYMVRVQNTSISAASAALTVDLNANGVTSNLATSYFDASTQVLGRQGAWSGNGVYFIAPAILGIALNP